MQNSCKLARDWHAKLTAFAGKNICNLLVKIPANKGKTPAIAGKDTYNSRQKIREIAGKLDCILQVKLPATCAVLYYMRSRVFCVRGLAKLMQANLPVSTDEPQTTQVNYVWGLFICVSPHLKPPAFASNSTVIENCH